ncbi:MAG: transcription antitermination factor NusB [Phycisphaerales bacterium]|nr:MAG: transcription antitermination factor NusB [Phycisphaerales bacterium]
MAGVKDIRRLAFQTLYQLDARHGDESGVVRDSLEGAEGFTSGERAKAFEMAEAAYARRKDADRELEAIAPDWPPSRQAAVDRSILRLAWHEMTGGKTPPKVVINEAIELAKTFSTDKSPAFINGVLDKLFKRLPTTIQSADANEPAIAPAPAAPLPPTVSEGEG